MAYELLRHEVRKVAPKQLRVGVLVRDETSKVVTRFSKVFDRDLQSAVEFEADFTVELQAAVDASLADFNDADAVTDRNTQATVEGRLEALVGGLT